MNRIDWMEKYMTEAEQLIYDNKIDQGLHMLTDLLYDEPGYGRLHNYIGWANLYYTQNVTQAELHFKMAIRFDETFAPPYLHMGTLCIRVGRYADAIEYFQRGLTRDQPNRVALLEGIAQAYELRKNYGQAIKFFRDALASSAGPESHNFMEGIKRCRKKRWIMMFSF